jgi:hypothetical protein
LLEGFTLEEANRATRNLVLCQNTRCALPWKTLLSGLVWIIQIVLPWGGST